MTPTVRHETKKDEILKSGLEVLWERGYNGTSISDIVNAADIPKGSFYFYFDSKENFAIEAIDVYIENMGCNIFEILEDRSIPAKRRLELIMESKLEYAANEHECEKGCYLNTLANEMAGHNENIRNALTKAYNQMMTPLVTCIQEAMDDGDISCSCTARELADFVENAWRGAIAISKATHSPDPFYNVQKIILTKILV